MAYINLILMVSIIKVSSTAIQSRVVGVISSPLKLLNIISRAGGAQISKIKPLGIDINVPYVQTGGTRLLMKIEIMI